MKKVLLTVVVALVMLMSMVLCVSAVSVTDDGTNVILGDCVIEGLGKEIPSPTAGLTYELDAENKTATVTALADEATTVTLVIPSSITYDGVTYKVTRINQLLKGTSTTYGNQVLTTLYIPDSVVTIGNKAFYNSRCLEYVYIGKNIVSIEDDAFCHIGFNVYYDWGGCVKEFICKSKNIKTIGARAFFPREIAYDAVREFDLMHLESVGAQAFSTTGYITNSDHHYSGTTTLITSLDLTNGVVYNESDSFKLGAGNQPRNTWDYLKVYANKLNTVTYDTAGTDKIETKSVIHLIGGETPEEAKTLSNAYFSAGLTYWTGKCRNMVIFDGYINANANTDGVTAANDRTPAVEYYFANETECKFYIDSVKATANGDATLKNYAGYKYGYFIICDGAGAVRYSATYDTETGNFTLTPFDVSSKDYYAPVVHTYKVLGENMCTPSTCCVVCDYVISSGKPHSMGTTLDYENGFFESGVKVTACSNDGCTLCDEITLAPIFYWVGFSAKTFGEYGFGQQYIINADELATYKAYLKTQDKTFSYGVVAAGASSQGNPLSVVNGAVAAKAGAEFITFDNVSYDAFFMNITGMTESDLDASLVCCAYVQLGDEVVYLDNNETVEKVTLRTYNEIDAIVNPKEEL